MEIGRRFSLKYVFIGLYIVAFLVYIIVGLQPAEAANYNIVAELSIPSIGLQSDVASLKLNNGALDTPDTIVGSYSGAENKSLLIGHSTTVFKNLNNVKIGDIIIYNKKEYVVYKRDLVQKDDILMPRLLKKEDTDTLVIMTCAGKLLNNGDATHRFLLTAEEVEE